MKASKLKLPSLIAVAMFLIGFYPQQVEELNLGFERAKEDNSPDGWYTGGSGQFREDLSSYIGQLDTKTVQSGKSSLHLKYVKGEGSGVASLSVDPKVFQGKMIRYTGWIKTKNVDGYAGLWWRVDSRGRTIAMNNMEDTLFNGTQDWKRFSFELPVDQIADAVHFGVLVSGKGEAWFDGLTIDTNGVRYAGQ